MAHEKVTETGCWIWTGPQNELGYGKIMKGRKYLKAHRLSYEEFVGPIPDGMFVCHKCDTPECINPKHLFLGTQKDNMADCARKGRVVVPRGEAAGRAMLTEEAVKAIRAEYVKGKRGHGYPALAAKYGVGASTIQAVIERRSWAHI